MPRRGNTNNTPERLAGGSGRSSTEPAAKPDYLKRFKHPANPILTAGGVEGRFDAVHVDGPKVSVRGSRAYVVPRRYYGEHNTLNI